MKIRICFFGTPKYSVIVLEKLFKKGYPIACIVTKPPKPLGRKKILTETPVARFTKSKGIPIITPEPKPDNPLLLKNEEYITRQILKYRPDILIAADFTYKIPLSLITRVKYGGLNIHPSLLPSYRGPAPIPWAILNGETETGVSIVTLSEKFDTGKIIAREKYAISNTDTTPMLLERLFTKGADLLVKILPEYIKNTMNYELKTKNTPSYFPRLSRETGFEPWEKIKKAIQTGEDAVRIDRKFRALHPWPGLWTKIKFIVHSSTCPPELSSGKRRREFEENKRIKILSIALESTTHNLQLTTIQLEGRQPISGKDVQVFLQKIIS